jgi:hypothetical protein
LPRSTFRTTTAPAIFDRYRLMHLPPVHTLYEQLAGSRWAFLYSGAFPDAHSARLILLAEEAAHASSGENIALAKKLAFVLVETYQNVIRHRAPLPPDQEKAAGRSLCMLRSDGTAYEVAAMNPVRAEEAHALGRILDGIRQNTDLRQLKEMFLRGLQTQSQSQRGGAGLGLIEMARRSTSGLHHEVRELGDGLHMFSIALHVGSSTQGHTPLEDLRALHATVAGLDALLAFKGQPTPGVQDALLRMIAADMEEAGEAEDRWTGVFLAALELIGEVPGQCGDPLILLGRRGSSHVLMTGLVLTPEEAPHLLAQARHLLERSPAELQKLYRDTLLERQEGPALHRGLVDLARRPGASLTVHEEPVANGILVLLGTEL